MCRNIKTLFNFEPSASEEEVRAAALQFVRKISGFNKPSQANQQSFDEAVEEVTRVAQNLLMSLTTNAAPRDREVEATKARERAAKRFRPGNECSGLMGSCASGLGREKTVRMKEQTEGPLLSRAAAPNGVG